MQLLSDLTEGKWNFLKFHIIIIIIIIFIFFGVPPKTCDHFWCIRASANQQPILDLIGSNCLLVQLGAAMQLSSVKVLPDQNIDSHWMSIFPQIAIAIGVLTLTTQKLVLAIWGLCWYNFFTAFFHFPTVQCLEFFCNIQCSWHARPVSIWTIITLARENMQLNHIHPSGHVFVV